MKDGCLRKYLHNRYSNPDTYHPGSGTVDYRFTVRVLCPGQEVPGFEFRQWQNILSTYFTQ